MIPVIAFQLGVLCDPEPGVQMAEQVPISAAKRRPAARLTSCSRFPYSMLPRDKALYLT